MPSYKLMVLPPFSCRVLNLQPVKGPVTGMAVWDSIHTRNDHVHEVSPGCEVYTGHSRQSSLSCLIQKSNHLSGRFEACEGKGFFAEHVGTMQFSCGAPSCRTLWMLKLHTNLKNNWMNSEENSFGAIKFPNDISISGNV